MWDSRTLQQRYVIYVAFPIFCLMLYLAVLPIFGKWDSPTGPGTWWTYTQPQAAPPTVPDALPPAVPVKPIVVPGKPIVVPVHPHTPSKPLALYGHLPLWHQIFSGAGGVPSAVERPGDVAFIDGIVDTPIKTMPVAASITNGSELRAAYSDCLIPLRLWRTVDGGMHWTDVTALYVNASKASSSARPFYLSCSGPPVTFAVPVIDSGLQPGAQLTYEISVDVGGNFATASGARIAPTFNFLANSAAA